MEWIATFLSIKGRINRGKYWVAQIVWGMGFICFFCIGLWVAEKEMTTAQDKLFYLVSSLIIIGLVYTLCAVAIKRFHDRDKSGWWIVPLILIPSPPGDVVETMFGKPFGLIWSAISGLVLTWTFIELGLLAGTTGRNRFGDAPSPSKAWPKQ